MKRTTRRGFLVGVGATATVGAASGTAAASTEDVLSGSILENAGYWSYEVGDVAKYNGQPSWIVEYDEGELSTLQQWVDGSDEREVVSSSSSSNRAVVAMSPDDIGVEKVDRWDGSDDLSARPYIQSIEPNLYVSYAEPVENLAGRDSYEPPVNDLFTRGGSWSQDGVAYDEDVEETDMGAVRGVLDVDTVAATGAGTRIAIIDTGLNTADGQLYGDGTSGSTLRVDAPYNALTDTAGLEAVADGNGHGSWCTTAIAGDSTTASDVGVAPGATIIPIKSLADDGSGSIGAMVSAIEHAKNNNADIISMSLGSPQYSPVIAGALQDFLENGGSAVVVAVGNSRQTGALRYISSPADVESVIGVGATNTAAPAEAMSANFSEVGEDNGLDGSSGETLGSGPSIGAPGMKISLPVADTSGVIELSALSGTSMATPMVAGVLALYLEANSALAGDHATIRENVAKYAEPVPNAGVTEVGAGMINAANLIDSVEPESSQSEVLSSAAEGRDVANRSLSGSPVLRAISGISTGISGWV